MRVSKRRGGVRRAPLSRERVLDAALALVDVHGVEALTMRRLAAALDVEAMTLYYHVPNKAAILDALVERVAGEFELPSEDVDWKPALRTTALSAYRVLSRHPWASRLMLSSGGLEPNRLRYMDAILGTLQRAGFRPVVADHAYHALEGHIMGFSLWVVGMNLGTPEELAGKAVAFLEQLPADEFPHVAAHIRDHLDPPEADGQDSFTFALDLLLDGLDRLRSA